MTMTTASVKLVEIPKCDWIKLRDLYKKDWPKNHLGYYVINNYIEWLKKEPLLKNITLYSVNGDWTDGTFIIIDRYQVLINTLTENFDRLVAGLCCLDSSRGYLISGFVYRTKPAVFKFLKLSGATIDENVPTTTIWHFMPRDEALKFDVIPPEGITLKPLTEKHAHIVNDVWPHKHLGSLFLLKRLIRLNPSVGAFSKDGELLSWCLQLQIGSLGNLQVIESRKRQGFGSLMIKSLSKTLALMGYDICAPVVEENTASRNLFRKLGFKEVDKVLWVMVNPNLLYWDDSRDD